MFQGGGGASERAANLWERTDDDTTSEHGRASMAGNELARQKRLYVARLRQIGFHKAADALSEAKHLRRINPVVQRVVEDEERAMKMGFHRQLRLFRNRLSIPPLRRRLPPRGAPEARRTARRQRSFSARGDPSEPSPSRLAASRKAAA